MAKKTTTVTPPKIQEPQYVIAAIMERANSRSRKDMADVMNAVKAAENPERPKRLLLYNLYDMLDWDNHISGMKEHSLKAKIMADRFRIYTGIGDKKMESEELMELFEDQWFLDFLDIFINEIFFGPSLAQIATVNGILTTELFPRRHYIPESGIITINQGDEFGYDIHDPALAKYLVPLGKKKDLGFFAKAAPSILFKRNALVCWSEFTEVFGMPMRIGKTNSRDPKDLDRMENALRSMGSAAYGIFNEGESIEIKESVRTDSYNVYDKLIERCNSELSKLFVGQTMTTDNGSSKSQGEVHERTLEDVVQFLKLKLQIVINKKVMPLLAGLGYKTDAARMAFDELKDTKHLWTVTQGLLQSGFDVDPEWIKETFGVPVVKKEDPAGGGNKPAKK